MNRSEIRENRYCVTYTYIQPHPPCAPWHTGSSLGTIHILRQQRTGWVGLENGNGQFFCRLVLYLY